MSFGQTYNDQSFLGPGKNEATIAQKNVTGVRPIFFYQSRILVGVRNLFIGFLIKRFSNLSPKWWNGPLLDE